MPNGPAISVSQGAERLVRELLDKAAEFKIGVKNGAFGQTVIDAGTDVPGSIAAGIQLAQVCMGGLGSVRLDISEATPRWPWSLLVYSAHPVVACLASQYAGWRLTHGEGNAGFFALGSGPARALARVEKLFDTLDYRDAASRTTLVLESGRPPPDAVVSEVSRACGIDAAQINIIYAPTQSLAGSAQVVARVLEVALHKAHELGFAIGQIVEGMGAAPLPPPHPDLVTAMGRTNDAIIYAGRVQLFVTGPADEARRLAERLPSVSSRDYGEPFANIFKRFKGDFYAIDPMLFSPAQVTVTALETGESFHAGQLALDLLDASFSSNP